MGASEELHELVDVKEPHTFGVAKVGVVADFAPRHGWC
jgi:hypothetical protein